VAVHANSLFLQIDKLRESQCKHDEFRMAPAVELEMHWIVCLERIQFVKKNSQKI